MLDNPFSEEIFHNIQSKPPLAHLALLNLCIYPKKVMIILIWFGTYFEI